MLDAVGARGLPLIVGVREEDRLGTVGLLNSLDSLDLVLGARDGKTVGVTLAWPAGLEVEDVRLARADLLEDVNLALDEGTGLGGGGVVVEEGVDVGTNKVNGATESGTVLLPDVDGLSGRDLAVVAGSGEGQLRGADETGKLAGGTIAALDSLITDDNNVDHIPLGPLGNSCDLRLSTRDAGAVDEDTDDHVQAVLSGTLTNVLETVAISGVDTDSGEALLLDDVDVLENVGLGLAATTVGIRRVGHAHAVATGGGRNGRGAGGSVGRSGRSGRAGGGRASRLVGIGEGRADIGDVGASGGHGLLRLGVGTRGERGWGRVDDDGARGDSGSRGGDGVGTSRRANVGRRLDDTGDGRSGRLDSSDRAGHGSRSLDNSRDTTEGVGATGHFSGSGTADSGGVGDGQGSGRDGVGTSGSEAGDARSGKSNRGSSRRGRFRDRGRRRLLWSRGRGLRSLSRWLRSRRAGRRDDQGNGRVAGRAQSGDSLGSDCGSWLRSLDGDDC